MLNRTTLSHQRQPDSAGREKNQDSAVQRRRRGYHWPGLLVVLGLFALLMLPTVAWTQSPTPTPCLMDGNLDPTFDADGRVTTPFGFGFSSDGATAVALQPDGKIVAAGIAGVLDLDFALARYNPNGSLDTTFDTDGKVTTDFGSNNDGIGAIALQPDGRIVAVGTARVGSGLNFALARYNKDGSLDPTFGTNGMVTTDFGFGGDGAKAVALQPDGKILVAGFATPIRGQLEHFALARYNPDGSLDTAFDIDGMVTTAFSSSDDSASAVVLQPDGKIVAVGGARFGGLYDFALARYNADGSLDTTFDTDGMVTTAFSSSHDQASAVVLQADGKIVAGLFAVFPDTGAKRKPTLINSESASDVKRHRRDGERTPMSLALHRTLCHPRRIITPFGRSRRTSLPPPEVQAGYSVLAAGQP